MMTWQLLALVVEVVTWVISPPTSLADAARREAFRRQFSAPAVAAVTNSTLPTAWPSELEPPVPQPVAAEAATPPPVVLTVRRPAPDAEPVQPSANDETAWRQRVASLRATLNRERKEAVAAESRLALLRTQAVTRDDPAQQALLRQEIGKALAEIEALTRRVDAGQRAIGALADEARRLGIPPGWLR